MAYVIGPGAIIFVMIVGSLVTVVAIEIMMTLFVTVPMIGAVCHSLKIYNFEAFEHAAATAEKSSKYAEGFADAMDVGAF